jgi:hypothetical protein
MHFWKYNSKLKKKNQSVTQIEVREKMITEPKFVAEAFADHFSSVLSSSSYSDTLNNSDSPVLLEYSLHF